MPLQITDINLQFLPNLYHPSLFDSSWSTLNHATEIASVNRTYETKNFILCKNNLSLILLMFFLASASANCLDNGRAEAGGDCVSWLSRDLDLVTVDKTIVIPNHPWSHMIIIIIHTNIIILIVSRYRAQIQWHAQITPGKTGREPNNKIRESFMKSKLTSI